MAQSSFIVDDMKLELPSDLPEEELTNFPAYKTWFNALTRTLDGQSAPKHPFHENPYRLRSISVQSIDRFGGGRLGFLKFKADVRTDDDQKLPASVFMRGGSVAMLLILKPADAKSDDEEVVILAKQPRIPAGTFSFIEIPAGMLDDSGTFSGAAAKEIEEETGLTIEEKDLIDMTRIALQSGEINEGHDQVLQDAIYPSPGGSDEFIPLFLARKTMPRSEIENMQGKLTGLRDHGEKISLMIVKLKDVWKVAGRDAKTLSALCMYDGLRREGKL
ncbi:hypothetical protein LTR70_006138 [Exophiala xenobiotica]|uniref:Nudix hydrolase domain-containing protein n=1 Tax=Lithohypha guttulata TaxID=1690604 RepID=A0ABR0K8D9_9EURO|nr:hypothetical protein LTR24_005625 [Lithohypha guttulata]KAK5316891.1 hypothetical protein LTR70_006138 [Exophiala xenobiotica]